MADLVGLQFTDEVAGLAGKGVRPDMFLHFLHTVFTEYVDVQRRAQPNHFTASGFAGSA